MPNWRKVVTSGSAASFSSLSVDTFVSASTISANQFTGSLFGTATTASFALNGGVTQILAGANVTIAPTNGLGQVTISSTSGGGGFNTATGSYGSFYSTQTQTNVAGTARSMSLNVTDITNGVSISGSTNPFNTYIKTENEGVYDIQFSAQIDKTDSGTDEIWIWLRKNGTNLQDTATSIQLTGNGDHYVAAWNFFVNSAANDYYQLMWYSPDANVRLHAEPGFGVVPGIPSLIVTANRVDQFLSNTGSFNGTFSGSFTGSLFGTASQAVSSSYAVSASHAGRAQSAYVADTAVSALSASRAGTADTASFVTTAQTASYVLNAVSSSYALTSSYFNGLVESASYAATASFANSFPDQGFNFTQTVGTASWTVNHNLNSFTPLVDVYDSSYNQLIPAGISSISANTTQITFSTAQAGFAIISKGSGISSQTAISASFATTASYASSVGINFVQISPSSTWTIVHNLNNKYPLVQIYDSSDATIIPASIVGTNTSTVTVTFSTAISGYARVI